MERKCRENLVLTTLTTFDPYISTREIGSGEWADIDETRQRHAMWNQDLSKASPGTALEDGKENVKLRVGGRLLQAIGLYEAQEDSVLMFMNMAASASCLVMLKLLYHEHGRIRILSGHVEIAVSRERWVGHG